MNFNDILEFYLLIELFNLSAKINTNRKKYIIHNIVTSSFIMFPEIREAARKEQMPVPQLRHKL